MIRAHRHWPLVLFLVTSLSLTAPRLIDAQTSSGPKPSAQRTPTQTSSSAEAHTAKAFEEARKQGPEALRGFLYRMPKGADLHNHLSGAVYAESWIRAAGEDHLCVDTKALAFTKPTGLTNNVPICKTGEIPASTVSQNQHLYDELIDAFSMRTFVPVTGDSGHDHFFATFDKFGGTDKRHMGEWLDEVATRAAAQNEQYLELMDTPDFKNAASLAAMIGYNPNFVEYREKLLSSGIKDNIAAISAALDRAEEDRKQHEHCGQPDAQSACDIKIRYIYQILRGLPPETVFAQVVQGFEAAAADPRFVGMNFVQPEDGYISMRDYRIQMQMLDAVHGFYPQVHISLHAGELAPGMVPPDGLTFHIRLAVEQGEAERIGHGVDVMYEDRPYELLKEMAAKHVMVEVNLTSNDVILNVKGEDHPFEIYRRYGVPVALSTDDEGVSRIDLTHEYVRASVTYPLSYRDLKKMVRTSLEHSFLPGASLWQLSTPETLDRPVSACAMQLGQDTPTGECADLVSGSEKAQQQWELERRFHAFESNF
ncbi:MAG TPA: adenosine deaminase [Silvibacterium sp.]|nr:adenosine deaminase [Silvibacterium sp.]